MIFSLYVKDDFKYFASSLAFLYFNLKANQTTF